MKKLSKFKNKFLILILVLLPALIMCGLYGTYEKQADTWEDYLYERKVEDSYELEILCKGIWVLAYEAMSSIADEEITPGDVYQIEDIADRIYEYFPIEADEVSQKEVEATHKQTLNRIIYGWQNEFEWIRQDVDYAVFTSDGKYLMGNASEKKIAPYLEKKGYDYYETALVIRVNANNNVSVIQTSGTEGSHIAERVGNYLRNENEILVYEGEYIDDYEIIAMPKDISIVLGIPEDSALLTTEIGEDERLWCYERTDIYKWMMGLVVLTVILTMILNYSGKMDLKRLKAIPIPFETVILVIILLAEYRDVGAVRVMRMMEGYDWQTVSTYIRSYPLKETMIYIWNIVIWMIPFAVVFVMTTSFCQVFTVGIRKYTESRSLIGKFYFEGWKKAAAFLKETKKIRLESGLLRKQVYKLIWINAIVVSLFCCLWFLGIIAVVIYTWILLAAAAKYLESVEVEYQELLEITRKIAAGDMDTEYKEMEGPFASYNQEISKIEKGLKKAVEKEIASQKMKTELITNVSHDLKTPLTAIITYVKLLQQEGVSEEDRKHYIDTLDRKSMRLKVLIEDLFEVSKAESKSMTMNYVQVNLSNLIRQVCVEYEDKFRDAGMELRITLPDEIILDLDSQRTYRIFENLLNNCYKYTLTGTRIYISASENEDSVQIMIRNISANELQDIDPDTLTERLVRGDQARNTEGSGLGLAIARNFTELQGGTLQVEIDADLFKVTVNFTKEQRRQLSE